MILHVTGLNMLSRCGIQFEFLQTLGPRAPRSAMIVGSGTHDSVEANLRHKIEAGELLSEDVVLDTARDAIMARVDRDGLTLSTDEATVGMRQVIGDMKDEAVSLARLHHREAAPKIEPVNVERLWELDITGTQHKLAGRIDIETATGIRDTKTTKIAGSQDKADTSDQLTMYGMAKTVLDGGNIGDLTFSLDYLQKLVTPKYKPFDTKRTDADVQALLMKVSQAFRVIDSGLFMPTSRENWWCSEQWCGYHDVCPYVGKKG